MKKYIENAYSDCILILNNGHEYEFYKNIDRSPKKIMLALSNDDLDLAIENGKKHINKAKERLKKEIEKKAGEGGGS